MNPLFTPGAVRLLILILFSSINIVRAQTWTQKNDGMFGGIVTDILVKEDTIFVATEHHGAGLYISADDGNTWKAFQTTLEWPKLFALKGDTIFVATSRGVFYSHNNGLSWVDYSAGMGNPQTESLEVVNGTLLAGSYSGLFRSTHRTGPWTLVTEGLPEGGYFTEVCVAGDKLFGMESGRLYTSHNDGESWERVEEVKGSVGDVIVTDDFIIAGGHDTVYVSVSGTFWSKVGEGLQGLTRSMSEKDGVIYAATSSGLYASDDNAVTFTQIDIQGLEGFEDDVEFVSVINDQIFTAPTYRGLFRSGDGETWTESNQGLDANQMMHIHQHDGILYASTFDLTYKSEDKGHTWEVMNNDSEGISRIATKNDSIIAQSPGRDYLAFSTDGGHTWSYETPPGHVPYLLGTEDNIVCVSSGDGLLMLGPDNEWRTLIPSDEHLGFHGILAMGDTLVTWSSQGIYFSTDYGTTWDNRINGLPQDNFSADEAVHHHKKVFATIQGRVFRTDDLGLTWSDDAGYISSSRTDYLYSDGEYLYAGTYEGVFASPDDGVSWMKIGEGLDTQTREMAIVDGELFAATKRGVWAIVADFTPQITSFSPTEGTTGTIVEIKGKYFASYLDSNVVTIGGDTAMILDAFDNNTIVVSVPEGATIGKITVTVNNHTGESAESFCLKPPAPVISMLSSSGDFPLLSSDNDTESHEWFLNGEAIPDIEGQLLDAVEFGAYTVRVSNGFCFSELSEEFCILPPAPSITASDNGDGTITLTSTHPSDNLWLHNGSPIDGATALTYVASEAGSYMVGVLIGNCFSDPSEAFCVNPATPSITDTPTGTQFPDLHSSSGSGNQWLLNGEAIENATNQNYNVMEPGEYTVQVSIDVCLSDTSDIFCVTPTPAISVISAGTGFPIIKSSLENGNQWFFLGEPIADATTQEYTTTEPGPYTVQLVTENCASEISSVFCVNPPKPTVSATNSGASLVLTSSSATGNQWHNDGVPMPLETGQTLTVTGAGAVFVIVSAGECLSEPSLPFLITDVDGTNARSALRVYPVPAKHILHVDLGSFTAHEPVDLILYDNVGATRNSLKAYGKSTVIMSLADVPPGVYYLETTSGLVREVRRVIKK